MVSFRILGPIEAYSDERRLELGGPRQIALLAFLLVHANRAVSTDQLIDALWDEPAATGAVKRLQVAIGRLRKGFEPLGSGEAEPVLRTVAGGYLFAVRPGVLDADVFAARVEAGRRSLADGDAASAADTLRAALGLWRGPALADVAYAPWAQADIASLEEQRLSAIETRVEADLRLGRHADVLGELRSLVTAHPTREGLVSKLMLALYRSGRHADALAAYRDAVRRLRENLGLEPGPALRDLERAVLAHDPQLAAPAVGGAGPVAARADETAELPGGTVTLLFTDIEGSTRLLTRRPERYAELLATHHELLRRAFAANGGREVNTLGDGLFVAFGRARDALAAAVDAQRSLAAHDWPEGDAVRVRIGLHSGEPALAAKDYVGLGVHRAARICAAAHGGQILVSNATQELVAEQRPPGVTLTDLGEYRLKDLERPERLYQVLTADLPGEFPPLNATAVSSGAMASAGGAHTGAARAQLPVPMTATIGRDRDLARVRALLDDPGTRLVTITGPGGVGKTRLAVEAARGVVDQRADGVRYVSLAAVTAAQDVAAAVARALPVTPAPGETLEDAIAQHLTDRDLLLVLDNFEHLLDSAPLVADILERAPRVTALVTSREPLCLRGEHVFALAPLPVSAGDEGTAVAPAVALFLALAQARGVGAASSEDIAAAVDICRRLDGLPLAIELAAGRLGLVSPPELARRLAAAGLDALGPAPRDAPARQRTLRATLEWSHALLSETEQTALARLAAVVGSCTLEAAEAVSGARIETLEGLVAKHLVVSERADDGSVRLRLLDTVHTFALERLAERTDREVAYRRHAEWYMALTERVGRELRTTGATDQLARLDADIDNIRAALDWAVVGADPKTLSIERVGLLVELGFALSEAGELARAEAILERAVAGAHIIGGPALQWRAALEHAWVRLLNVGVMSDALDTAERAIAPLTAAGDEEGLARAWQLIGMCRQWQASGAAAQEALERALGHAAHSGARHAETETLVWLLIVYAQGPLPADEGIRRCTHVLGSGANLKVRAYALIERGVLAAMQGQLSAAREDVAAGRALLRELGLDVGAAITSVETVIVELLGDQPAHARDELLAAQETLERMGERAFALGLLWALAEVACVEGDPLEALELSDRTESMATDENPHAQISWRRVKALALAELGELATAERLAREAVKLAYQTDSRIHRGDTSLALGTVLQCAGRGEGALSAYRDAAREFQAKGDIVSAARARSRAASVAVPG